MISTVPIRGLCRAVIEMALAGQSSWFHRVQPIANSLHPVRDGCELLIGRKHFALPRFTVMVP
jgi:hypothetical protein